MAGGGPTGGSPHRWRRRRLIAAGVAILLLAAIGLAVGPVLRAVDIGNLDQALNDSLTRSHSGQDAVQVWSRLGAAMAGLQDADHGNTAEVDKRVGQMLGRVLTTPGGQQDAFATDNSLEGQVLQIPAPHSAGAFLAIDARAAVRRLSVYFINGILTTNAEAAEDAIYLRSVLGREIKLEYNHSVKNPRDYLAELCMRDLRLSVKASGACELARGVVKGADLARGLAELIGQELEVDAASSAVASGLLPKAEADLTAGASVIIIGHSQGTLFARSILEQLNTWWSSQRSNCAGGPAAPVAALYISPAFSPPANSPGSNERYVALQGDVLGTLKIGPTATAVPTRIQNRDVMLHGLYTYLRPDSESRQQVVDRFRELVDYTDGRVLCPAPLPPTVSATPSAVPTTTPPPTPPPAPGRGAATPIQAVQALRSATCAGPPRFSIATGCPITVRLQDALRRLLEPGGPGAADPICRCQNGADVTYAEKSNAGGRALVTVTYHFSPPYDITWAVVQLQQQWFVDDSYCGTNTSTSVYASFGACSSPPTPPPTSSPAASLAGTWVGSYSTFGYGAGACSTNSYQSGGTLTITVTAGSGGTTFSGTVSLDGLAFYDTSSCQGLGTSTGSGSISGTVNGSRVDGQFNVTNARTGDPLDRTFVATLNGSRLTGTLYSSSGEQRGSFDVRRG